MPRISYRGRFGNQRLFLFCFFRNPVLTRHFQIHFALGLILAFCWARNCSATGTNTNSWTNVASGNWEDVSWSLGAPPTNGELVMLTNSGWKAVAIGPNTVQGFPQTMTIASLTISSPTDSFNSLLLNFAGVGTPLTAGSVNIGTNASLTLLSSALTVQNGGGGNLSIGGAFSQGEFSRVTADILTLGTLGPGVYNLTNGSLTVGTENVGGGFASAFKQSGGTNSASNLQINSGSEYDLYDGSFIGAASLNGGALNQYGGSFNSTGLGVSGTVLLEGGNFSGGMIIPAGFGQVGSVTQTGGTNQGGLTIGIQTIDRGFPGHGNYTLSNGVVITPGTTIDYFGVFSQFGGTHTINGALVIQGAFIPPSPGQFVSGSYNLANGMLTANSISSQGTIVQTGGTNQVAGDLNVGVGNWYDSSYTLSAGVLTSANTTVLGANFGGFHQTGGSHVIGNLLRVDGAMPGYAGYDFSGGTLIVPNIEIDNGAVFHHNGGVLAQIGVLALANGTWAANLGAQPLGQLQLNLSGGTVTLPAGACAVRFADSSSLAWSAQAALIIENWNGSIQGGGNHQVTFGASATSLTAQQLSQIQFHNPVGAPPGLYPARILATGEITPGPVLASMLSGKDLVLSWDAGSVLQTATEASGPFVDLQGVSSPYTNHPATTEPRRFFRLRR